MTSRVPMTKIIAHLNSFESINNITYSSNNKSLIDMLMDLTLAISGGTFPGDSCYMDKLPTVILEIILTFLPYKNRCITQQVCKSMNTAVYEINIRYLSQLNVGCELWVSRDKCWTTGTILSNFYDKQSSIVELIDIKSRIRYVGYNIRIDYGGNTLIKKSDIFRYTHIGSIGSLPKAPPVMFEYLNLYNDDTRSVAEIHNDNYLDYAGH
jgi:hypothetical protein